MLWRSYKYSCASHNYVPYTRNEICASWVFMYFVTSLDHFLLLTAYHFSRWLLKNNCMAFVSILIPAVKIKASRFGEFYHESHVLHGDPMNEPGMMQMALNYQKVKFQGFILALVFWVQGFRGTLCKISEWKEFSEIRISIWRLSRIRVIIRSRMASKILIIFMKSCAG